MAWAMGRPIAGVGLPVVVALNPTEATVEQARVLVLVFQIGWAVGDALIAWLILEATVLTFDRCLGRMAERTSGVTGGMTPGQRLGLENSWRGRSTG